MPTRLQFFIEITGIKPAWLARESGVSRQHILRLRRGQMEPTRQVMVELVNAASRVLHRPVYTIEMFVLGRADEAIR
jgi:transcriptional regulator with XRE-family HTH domain